MKGDPMFLRVGWFVLISTVFLILCIGRSSALELSSLSCYGVDSGMDVAQLRATLADQGFDCRESRLPGSSDSRQLVFSKGQTQLSVLTYGPQILEIFTPEVVSNGERLGLGLDRQQVVSELGLPNSVERADEVELLYYRSGSGEFGVQLRQGKVDLFRLSPAQSSALVPLTRPYESGENVPRSAVGMCILGMALLALAQTVKMARTRLVH